MKSAIKKILILTIIGFTLSSSGCYFNDDVDAPEIKNLQAWITSSPTVQKVLHVKCEVIDDGGSQYPAQGLRFVQIKITGKNASTGQIQTQLLKTYNFGRLDNRVWDLDVNLNFPYQPNSYTPWAPGNYEVAVVAEDWADLSSVKKTLVTIP